MFDRRSQARQQNTFATGAAIFVIAGIFATPVLAATSARNSCPETAVATLEVPLHVLTTELLTNRDTRAVPSADDNAIEKLELASSSSLLAPRAEAAIREAFRPSNAVPMAGIDSEPGPASDSDEGVETDSAINTKLPGVSDDDFSQYRKQMYRRDI